MRRTPYLSALALLTLAAALPAAAQYTVLSTADVAVGGNLVRTDTLVEVDGEQANRFQMHRLRKPNGATQGALLLLPPLANPFAFYETDEEGVYDRSFAAFYAHQGWEVWGYTPRGHQLTTGTCESGAVDCSPMAGWGLGAIVDDALWIRDRIGDALGVEPVLGGYSLGAIATIAALDAAPDAWRGAMIVEGGLYTTDPVIRGINQFWCDLFEAQLAGGLVFDGTTAPTIKLIAALALNDPDGPTPLPGFPPGTTNHQVLVAFLGLPADNPVSPTPDFVRCVGSFADDEFFYCDDDRLQAHLGIFLDYADNRTFRDINCSLAGETTFTDNLGAVTVPVYLLGGALGFGEIDDELESLFTATTVTRQFFPAYGHADFWFRLGHHGDVEADVLVWLNSVP